MAIRMGAMKSLGRTVQVATFGLFTHTPKSWIKEPIGI